MEIQATIRHKSETSLGALEAIEGMLLSAFPCISFEWTLSGPERLARVDLAGLVLPPVVRKIVGAQTSNRCAEWSDGTVEMTLNMGHMAQVYCMWLTISGDDRAGNRVLSLLSGNPGWVIEAPGELRIARIAATDPVTINGEATLFVSDSLRETDR